MERHVEIHHSVTAPGNEAAAGGAPKWIGSLKEALEERNALGRTEHVMRRRRRRIKEMEQTRPGGGAAGGQRGDGGGGPHL